MNLSAHSYSKKAVRSFCAMLASLVFATASVSLYAQSQPYKIGGFIQTVASKAEDSDGFQFNFDRVRLKVTGTLNPRVDFKLFVDFVKQSADLDKDGDSPGLIKDAEMRIKAHQKLLIIAGKTKTPIGMEFAYKGSDLDFVKRGLGQALIFERNLGVLAQAQKLNAMDLGVDIGLFNPGPNNAAVIGNPATGQDYSLTARVHAKPVKNVYVEAYYGNATTSVDSQSNVGIFGAGFKSSLDKIWLKGEFMTRDDANNSASDGTDLWVGAGYRLNDYVEPVVKYEKLDVTNDSKDQAITVLGVNFFFNPKNIHQSKIQLNYLMSNLDGKDAIQIMFQVAY